MPPQVTSVPYRVTRIALSHTAGSANWEDVVGGDEGKVYGLTVINESSTDIAYFRLGTGNPVTIEPADRAWTDLQPTGSFYLLTKTNNLQVKTGNGESVTLIVYQDH